MAVPRVLVEMRMVVVNRDRHLFVVCSYQQWMIDVGITWRRYLQDQISALVVVGLDASQPYPLRMLIKQTLCNAT